MLPGALAFCAAFGSCTLDRAMAAERFVAWLADGRRISAPRLTSWHSPATMLQLQGHGSDPGGSGLRLIRDRQAKVELKPPYLVLANGDVLTGSPVQLEPDLGRQGLTPRVRVQLEGMLPVSGTGVSIRTDRIARIVGSGDAPQRQEPPPGTVQLADGRRLVGRSIKWREYGLAVLTPDGIVEANFPDIVDAVLPGVDTVSAVLEDNLVAAGAVSPADSGPIVRFQLTSGATITAARIRRQQETQRRSRRGGVELTTYYYTQPAWADQPLALPEKDVAWCGYREADEAPLALFPAELESHERLVWGGAAWQRVEAAEGLPATGVLEADLALATHSQSELAITLPPGAKSLQTTVGLDRAVGAGGCVRCRIVAEESTGKTLWDSGIFTGGDEPKPTGPLDVAGLARVVLVTEFAHEGRPAGADPLDIRDQVVWLAPLVELDLDEHKLLPLGLAGMDGWQLSGSGQGSGHEGEARTASEWDASGDAWESMLVLPPGGALTLSRTLQVSRSGDVVEFLTSCPEEEAGYELELAVNGSRTAYQVSLTPEIQRQWLRYRDRARWRDNDRTHLTDRFAYWWDLSPWRGKEVTLALTVRSGRGQRAIAWRGLSIRGAIANLPASGEPLAFDVPLTSLTPLSASSGRARGMPVKNGLPSDRAGEPIRFLGQAFHEGYGMAYNSVLSFELRADYRRFVAVAGCPLFVAGPLQILIDGKVAWERPLMSGLEPAEQIDIAIPAGAKTITLQTGPESSYTGLGAFAEAGFITRP
jgi:hypothetical protein